MTAAPLLSSFCQLMACSFLAQLSLTLHGGLGLCAPPCCLLFVLSFRAVEVCNPLTEVAGADLLMLF